MDEALAQAFGPERSEEIRQALEGLHIGADIDEIDIPGIIRRRIEIIFGAVSEELVQAFDILTQGATTAQMVETAVVLGNIFAAFEQGNQIFADTETVLDTVNALVNHFQHQGEELGETLQRIVAGMVLINELRDDNIEASTGFARMGEEFVAALGGMAEAITKTDRFIRIFSQTQSGLEVQLRDATQAVEDAFSAIGVAFDPSMPITLDEFNRAFLDVQNSLSAADLALWVEAGLSLADFIAVYEQLPEVIEEVVTEIEESVRDIEGLANTLASIRQRAVERGMSDYDVQVFRVEQGLSETIAALVAMGATEEELAFVREQARLDIEELAAAEQARLDAIAEAQEQALQDQIERDLAARERYNQQQEAALERELERIREHIAERERLQQEAEQAELDRVRDIQQFFQGIDNDIARQTMPDFEYQVRLLNQSYAAQVQQLIEMGGSEEDLRHLRALYHRQLDLLIQSEQERNERLAEQAEIQRQLAEAEEARLELARLAEIESIMTGISQAIDASGLEGLEREIYDISLATQAMVDRLVELGATEDELARAVEYGQQRIRQAREAALRAELDALDRLKDEIESLFGGLIERIRTDLRSPEQNYDYYRQQAEALAATIPFIEDPDELARIVREIERYTGLAWGLLDPGQQAAAGDAFIQFLEDVSRAAAEREAAIRAEAYEQYGIDDEWISAVSGAGTDFAAAAQTIDLAFSQFMSDALTLGPALQGFGTAVSAFREAVDTIDRAASKIDRAPGIAARPVLREPEGVVNA